MIDYGARLQTAVSLVRAAAPLALERFGRVCGQSKRDGTFVTQADKEVELQLLADLQANFPGEGIIGEETGSHPGEHSLVWSIDPIDGTAAYLCRLPSWGISLGLIAEGQPALGVVYLPALDELYYGAKGCGAYMESPLWKKQRLDVSTAALSQKENQILVPSTFHNRFTVDYKGKIRSLGSTVAHAMMVARGDAAGALMRVYHWDLAGSIPILLEAGGCVDYLDGRPFQIEELTKENPNLPVVILSHPKARAKLLDNVFHLRP